MNVNELLSAKDLKTELEKISFEDVLKLLDELVNSVESGKMPLESSVVAYEKGAVLIEFLKSKLQAAEARIEVIKKSS